MQNKLESKKIDVFIKTIKKQYPELLIKRWEYILKQRLKGVSYGKIGIELDVTRQRIRQIETFLLKKIGSMLHHK